MVKGKVLSKGIGYGYAYNFSYNEIVEEKKEISLQDILDTVKKELQNTYEDTENISEEEAMIFEAHMTLLEDCTFIEGIEALVNDGMPLSRAIMENGKKNAFVFMNMEDKALSHIAEDIMDISYQMVDVLKESTSQMKVKEPVVICCENIYPSSLLNFISHYKVAAIISKETSDLSHSAIIARASQIPFITGVETDVKDKLPVIVNGDENEIYFNPNYQKMMEIKKAPEKKTSKYADLSIEIKANAGALDDVLKVSKATNASIGLFRSEYFYLKAHEMPTYEQVQDYMDEIFFGFNDREMDYRLPDFGRDKSPDYINNDASYNGMEFLLSNMEILKQQIMAFKNSKNRVNKRILLPYVQNRDEITAIREMIDDTDICIGSMIESGFDDSLLEEIISLSDFVNIGTNDLITYFSGNDRLSYLDTDEEHIIEMFEYIKKVADIAHKSGLKVCICGEIASDEDYIEKIVESGVDSISVSAFHILNK